MSVVSVLCVCVCIHVFVCVHTCVRVRFNVLLLYLVLFLSQRKFMQFGVVISKFWELVQVLVCLYTVVFSFKHFVSFSGAYGRGPGVHLC